LVRGVGELGDLGDWIWSDEDEGKGRLIYKRRAGGRFSGRRWWRVRFGFWGGWGGVERRIDGQWTVGIRSCGNDPWIEG
jgi:hypothetical protein